MKLTSMNYLRLVSRAQSQYFIRGLSSPVSPEAPVYQRVIGAARAVKQGLHLAGFLC